MRDMTVYEFEQRVRELEGIVIRIRAPAHTEVEDYDYVNAAAYNVTVATWIQNRVRWAIGDLEVSVLNGDGNEPYGGTHMGTLRETYD